MAKKRGLGRGLDALLGSAAVAHAETDGEDGTMRELPVDLIRRGRYQPRMDMNPEALEELASSIRVRGVVQPVVVRSAADGVHYELIAGERRWRAAQLAGLDAIPAVVRAVADDAALAMGLIENIQREDLNPVEEANALKRLIEEFDLTHQAAADAIGRSRAAVSNLLRLLELDAEVRTMLERGELEMGHARALLGLEAALQRQAAAEVSRKGLSARETETLVKRLRSPKASRRKTSRSKDPDVQRLEEELAGELGAVVRVRHGASGRGSLTVEYSSLEQLDGIIARLKG
ncbi:MAG TPA: ParB/RepB/Spo0J family partition protein [Gammaproteobacteria bacterium]|nr:ParB/RepB/Spo0J family partition protein [Gammaproteobacteria bacterium]